MYMQTLGCSRVGLGVPPTADVLLRHFACGPTELAAVRGVVGNAVSADQLRAAVRDSLVNAVTWARAAAAALSRSERDKGNTPFLFEEAFGTTAAQVPSWRPPGQTWNLGDVVRARLLFAAQLLAGGSIHFFCWGDTRFCPECSDDPATYFACSSWGKRYVVCLGRGFWRDWRAGLRESMAATMLHEALHIYFSRLVAHGETGRYGDANCYARFALRSAKVNVPARVRNRCAALHPVGDFPAPAPGARHT